MRKKILEPIKLNNKIANACFQFGKERAFGLFSASIEYLYCNLLSSGEPSMVTDEVLNISSVYINEVRKKPAFLNILGAAMIELSPYRTDDNSGSPYIPDSIMELMVRNKNMTKGFKTINDKDCGCGAYILSLMSALKTDFGDSELLEWSVSGTDSDLLSTKICAIQVLTNLATHNTCPGSLTLIHKPFDSSNHEYLMLKLNYNKISKQYEIMNKNKSWVNSAQTPLFS